VNLREQLERTTGSMVSAGRDAVPSSPARLVARFAAAVALAVLVTFALGASGLSRGAPMLAGAIAMNLLLVGGMTVALRQLRPAEFESAPAIALLALLSAVTIAAAAAAARLVPGAPELVPVAFVAIVVSALFDRRLGLLVAIFLAALIGVQPAYRSAPSLTVMLVAGAAAALVVRPVGRRDQSYLWMLVTAIATTLALLATGLAEGSTREEILASLVRGLSATVVSVIAAVLALPFAERWTGRETHLTLLEWGDLNRPLLQRLSLEAPGTYAHTIAIANLAEAACRAIGANAVLARVGSYYHDIGKLAKPQYFVENQPRGRNIHDKLKPQTSASIIRNHVREGLELAEAERIPRSIRAFISEHHGTGTIAFFLEKAREREGVVPNAGEFSYPGPVPQSVETAVVMLADGAEAATRALADPTPERIREVIDFVLKQRLDQGQLRDAPLTLRQLTIVKQQFARVLGGMYHARVDYPTPPMGVEAARR
jgi:putative nucleotidyltransferase with HDIG domain